MRLSFGNILEALRINKWWHHKLPPLFGFAYLFLFALHVSFFDALPLLILLGLWMFGAAGFGYYLNDVFDIAADHVAGKRNVASTHAGIVKVAILFVLFLLALVPWMLIGSVLIFALVFAHLLLFVLYSVPPFRLKDRGILGATADAIYAHALPAAVAAAAVFSNIPTVLTSKLLVIFGALVTFQFFTGLRNILIHQVRDMQSDIDAGAGTVVIRHGVSKVDKVAFKIIFPTELLSFALFLSFILCFASPYAFLLIIFLMLLRFIRYKYFHHDFFKNDHRKMFFFNDVYEEDLPLTFLLMLSLFQIQYFMLLLVHAIFFPRFWKRFFQEILIKKS